MHASLDRRFAAPVTNSCLIAAVLAATIAVATPSSALASNPNPGVAPAGSSLQGLTAGEWSAKWWRWALETPADESPLLDTTGANCAVAQAGHVWFLAGTLGPGAPVVRTCTIPAGTSLFFPAANAFCVAEGDGTFETQQACAAAFLAELTSMSVEIDGAPVSALDSYRAPSPAFDLILPDNNVFGAPAGVYTPTAADGFYLMLRPLASGQHTIHIRAEFGADAVDVTYLLTVRAPRP